MLPVSSEGHTGHCVFWRVGRDQTSGPSHGRGGGIIGTHASPFLFGPLHCSSCHHLMFSPFPSVLLSESTRTARGALRELSEPYPAQGTALGSSCLRWDSEALLYFMRLPCVWGAWYAQVLVSSPRNRCAYTGGRGFMTSSVRQGCGDLEKLILAWARCLFLSLLSLHPNLKVCLWQSP